MSTPRGTRLLDWLVVRDAPEWNALGWRRVVRHSNASARPPLRSSQVDPWTASPQIQLATWRVRGIGRWISGPWRFPARNRIRFAAKPKPHSSVAVLPVDAAMCCARVVLVWPRVCCHVSQRSIGSRRALNLDIGDLGRFTGGRARSGSGGRVDPATSGYKVGQLGLAGGTAM